MARQQHNKTTGPEWDMAQLHEKQVAQDIAHEKWQVARMKELARQMAEECPAVWRWGDGDGGHVHSIVADAYEEAGLRTEPLEENIPLSTTPVEFTLYRFYGVEDGGSVLLYVGITANPLQRWTKHFQTKHWAADVQIITREQYPTRALAMDAERRAIRSGRPRYNVMHNGVGEQ